jgi:hypothetical protein
MNWEAVGAIAELTGALAVVFSLVYLAVQIRQSTRVARVTAHDNAVATIRDLSRIILDDPQMPDLLRRGILQEQLSDADTVRFGQFTYTFFKASENLHFHWRQGTIDDDTFHGWESMVATYAGTAAMKEYRLHRASFFPTSLHDWMDSLEAAGAGEPLLTGFVGRGPGDATTSPEST